MTPKPRVLIVHTHPIQYLAPLFQRYAESGVIDLTVAYCSVPDSSGRLDKAFGIETDWGLDLLSGYPWVQVRAISSSKDAKSVWRLIGEGEFDSVFAYGYSFLAAWTSLLACKRFGVKWACVGDNHTLVPASGRPRPGKRFFLRALGRVADKVVAQSVLSQRHFERYAGEKVRLVPHAIDDERFRHDAALGPAVERDASRTVFLFVGKLVANKRVADLIDAAAFVPTAEVWIVGTGPDAGELRRRAESRSVKARFFGFVDQRSLPAVYDAADVVVLPSRSETFGLCVSEGAAVGRTAIVSRACGVVESLLLDGVTGLVFESLDVQALAQAMQAMTEPSRLQTFSAAMTLQSKQWSSRENVRAFTSLCRDMATD